MQNEMRDRLVELLQEYTDKNNGGGSNHGRADHLIENGVIVPPCKVGETLYLIQIDFNGNYSLTECLVNSKITMLSIMRAYEEHTVVYMSTDKAAAEQRLKELEGDRSDETDS